MKRKKAEKIFKSYVFFYCRSRKRDLLKWEYEKCRENIMSDFRHHTIFHEFKRFVPDIESLLEREVRENYRYFRK